ncbi:Motile Sperm domain containing protein [Trichuris trichiura]|uniref:Major sperm protein n=1 Tax=Trichuris trichiura TaxID=36087 RepID=A0A077ZHT4_TRITR|nr:Motile Sperm domain containing protein [Trichuris trichiura]
MQFEKGTLEIVPSDVLHFCGDAGVAQITYLQFYNNSKEYAVYRLRSTSPAEIGFEPAFGILEPFQLQKVIVHCTLLRDQHGQQNKERCTVMARLIPDGFEGKEVNDNMETKTSSDYIEKMYRLEIRYDLDSCDILQPTTSSGHLAFRNVVIKKTSKVSSGFERNDSDDSGTYEFGSISDSDYSNGVGSDLE